MAILEVKHLCKDYQMGKVCVHAVSSADFSIEQGEFASVSGPSGSGKSTLLNLMGLIDLPTSGEIIVNGVDVYKGQDLPSLKSIPPKLDNHITELRRQNLGFIFQNFNLIQVLNVYENVMLPLQLGSLPQERYMTKAQEAEWIDFLIDTVGLTDWKRHKPSELSGGQRQRVAIARALVTRAPVILADEPTANLDSKNGDQILELMKKLNRELKTTFIFSTHDAKIVEMSDHVIRIKDGIILGQEYRKETGASVKKETVSVQLNKTKTAEKKADAPKAKSKSSAKKTPAKTASKKTAKTQEKKDAAKKSAGTKTAKKAK